MKYIKIIKLIGYSFEWLAFVRLFKDDYIRESQTGNYRVLQQGHGKNEILKDTRHAIYTNNTNSHISVIYKYLAYYNKLDYAVTLVLLKS